MPSTPRIIICLSAVIFLKEMLGNRHCLAVLILLMWTKFWCTARIHNTQSGYVNQGGNVYAAESFYTRTTTVRLLSGITDFAGRGKNTTVVKYKSILLRGSVMMHDPLVRVAIVLDRKPKSRLPNADEIFSFPYIQKGSYHMKYLANPKDVNSRRFEILKDELFANNEYNHRRYHSLEWNIPLNIFANYAGDSGKLSDIQTNALYLVYFGDSPNSPPSISNPAHKNVQIGFNADLLYAVPSKHN